jgi:hypothetical protein
VVAPLVAVVVAFPPAPALVPLAVSSACSADEQAVARAKNPTARHLRVLLRSIVM